MKMAAERQPAFSGVRFTKQGARRWKVLRRAPGTHGPAAPTTTAWRRERWPEPQGRRAPQGQSGLTRWSSWRFPKIVGNTIVAGHLTGETIARCHAPRCSVRNTFRRYPGARRCRRSSFDTVARASTCRSRLLVDAGRKVRHTFPEPDLFLAATALHHGLTLVTRNVEDYRKASGVSAFNPWADPIPAS